MNYCRKRTEIIRVKTFIVRKQIVEKTCRCDQKNPDVSWLHALKVNLRVALRASACGNQVLRSQVPKNSPAATCWRAGTCQLVRGACFPPNIRVRIKGQKINPASTRAEGVLPLRLRVLQEPCPRASPAEEKLLSAHTSSVGEGASGSLDLLELTPIC